MADSRSYSEKMRYLRTMLDWSQLHMGREIGLQGEDHNVSKRLHEYEINRRPISGPIEKLIDRIAAEHHISLHF